VILKGHIPTSTPMSDCQTYKSSQSHFGSSTKGETEISPFQTIPAVNKPIGLFKHPFRAFTMKLKASAKEALLLCSIVASAGFYVSLCIILAILQ